MGLTRILIGIVQAYRLLLSPWLGTACRFNPTCSAYALQALIAHGGARGSYLTVRRLARCHPWCAGGHDPVPDAGDRDNSAQQPVDAQQCGATRLHAGRNNS